jgi:hypothetical protein
LDVVIVAQHLVSVAVQQANGVGALPILEMDAAIGEDRLHRLHEFLDEFVEFLLGWRRFAHPEIERIRPKRRVGRADIEQHGQQAIGRHRRAGGIELQFADRDSHAVGADIAETENPPAGRDADEAHIAFRPIPQDLRDTAFHVARDIHAARAPVDVSEGEAGIGDRRVVEDRHKARRVGHDGAVEQRLVPVRQPDQIDVAFEVGRFCIEMTHDALDLPVEALDRMRQQPLQPTCAALFEAEGSTLVANRIV